MKNVLKKILLPLLAVVLVVAVVLDAFLGNHEDFQDSRFLMGTVATLSIEDKKIKDKEKIAGSVFNSIEALENLISKNKEETPVFLLNENGEIDNQPLCKYIEQCKKISLLSEGAFDISVGALSSLWDFDEEQSEVPNISIINNAISTVDYKKIAVDGNKITIPKGTILDFGAAGKGMACDVAMKEISSQNVKNAIVAVGGSVGVVGKKAVVGIRDPFGGSSNSFATINFANAVASTSGVYEKHFVDSGINYHHILDPETGFPVQSNLVSITVISQDGLASDALATACFKLGFDKSKSILDEYNAMAVFVYNDKKVKTINEKYDFKIIDNAYEK